MYLSRMYLNPQRRQTKALLASSQKLHAAVLSCFPPETSDEEGRVLWRVDKTDHRLLLYIVSPRVPSFEHLQEQAGWSQESTGESRDYTPLLDRLTRGQRFAFRLTANPVHTLTTETGKKRVAHLTAEHQLRWFLDRQDMMGVSIPDVDVPGHTESETMRAVQVVGNEHAVFNRRGRRVTIVRATYEGVLEVTDVDKLRFTLIQGIGKAKGYGCGLLTLAGIGSAR